MTATNVLTIPQIADDQREWEREHLAWRQDVDTWLEEHRNIVGYLNRLAELVESHGDSLETHRSTIDRHESHSHATGLTGHHHLGTEQTGREQETLAEQHLKWSSEHARQRAEHQRLEQEHRVLMAHLAMLRSALEASRRISS